MKSAASGSVGRSRLERALCTIRSSSALAPLPGVVATRQDGRWCSTGAARTLSAGRFGDSPPGSRSARLVPEMPPVFNFTVLLHEVVHQTVFAGAAPAADRLLGLLYAVPSGLSPRSSRAGTSTTTPSWAPTEHDPKRHHLSPKRQRALVQGALPHAGALPDLLPRGAARGAPPTRPTLRRRIAVERAAVDRCCTSRSSAALWYAGPARPPRSRAYLRARLLRLPDRLHAEPPGPALRHRPGRPGASGARSMRGHCSGTRVPQFELPPRAPLLPARALLPPAGAASPAHAVLRAARHPRQSYGGLLWDWLVENRAPHTNWAAGPRGTSRTVARVGAIADGR